MVRIGNVPAIVEVKKSLTDLQERGLVKQWALPYEGILTRLDAAIFFLAPTSQAALEEIWTMLSRIPGFKYQENVGAQPSNLPWQVRFRE